VVKFHRSIRSWSILLVPHPLGKVDATDHFEAKSMTFLLSNCYCLLVFSYLISRLFDGLENRCNPNMHLLRHVCLLRRRIYCTGTSVFSAPLSCPEFTRTCVLNSIGPRGPLVTMCTARRLYSTTYAIL